MTKDMTDSMWNGINVITHGTFMFTVIMWSSQALPTYDNHIMTAKLFIVISLKKFIVD